MEEAEGNLVALWSYEEEKIALARELQRTLLERERERRRDHDRLQELKGNIRVFCRVRPALSECIYFSSSFVWSNTNAKR